MSKTILCYGDSNTWGLIPGTTNRFPEYIRWTGRLSNMLSSEYKVVEEGLCGRTTQLEDISRIGRNGLSTFSMILESHKPIDFIILMLGTNDMKTHYHQSPSDIASGISKLISTARKYSPNSKILIVSPIELGEGIGEEGFDIEFDNNSVEVSRRLPEEYKRISEKYGVQFLKASDYVGPSAVDREHLDEEGHRVLSHVLKSVVLNTFEKELSICG